MAKKSDKKPVIDMKLFSSATDVLEEEKRLTTLSIGPSLDEKTGGGILEGSFVLIRTPAKVGKTSLAMQIAVNALKQGRYVIFVDAERRLSGNKYFKIREFNESNKKLMILRSKESEEPLTGNDIYKIIKDMMKIPKYAGALYVIDSFSKILPKDTAESKEVTANRRDSTPKLNSDFCKQAGNLVRTTRSIIVGIQHLITDTSSLFGGLTPDGGLKLEYESDYVFDARHKPCGWDGAKLNSKLGEKIEGQMIKFQIPYNKTLGPWVSKEDPAITYIKYGEGIWWAREALELLLNDIGLAYKPKSGGSWIHLCMPNGDELKANGKDNAVELIEEHRETFEKIIRDYFVEKYKVNYDFVPPDSADKDDQDEES